MPSDAAHELRSIGDRYWEALLATTTLTALNQNGVGYLGGPIYATSIGDHRFDDKIDDLSPEALASLIATMRGLRDELERVPASELRGEDALSYEILREQLRDAAEAGVCKMELWLVDAQNGPQTQLAQTAQGYRDPKALAARLSQATRYFAQVADNLRRGLAQGLVSPRANVTRVIEQLDSLIAAAPSPFGHDASAVLPALATSRDFLREEILPKSRADDRLGVWALPNGADCYSFLVRRHTGGTRTPEELHQLGLDQLRSIEDRRSNPSAPRSARTRANSRRPARSFSPSTGTCSRGPSRRCRRDSPASLSCRWKSARSRSIARHPSRPATTSRLPARARPGSTTSTPTSPGRARSSTSSRCSSTRRFPGIICKARRCSRCAAFPGIAASSVRRRTSRDGRSTARR
jgi:hypothetical protein